jgi:hypothetical protein
MAPPDLHYTFPHPRGIKSAFVPGPVAILSIDTVLGQSQSGQRAPSFGNPRDVLVLAPSKKRPPRLDQQP